MLSAFIAVIIVMIVMLLFMIVVLSRITDKINKRIRQNALDELSVFDTLIENKMSEIQKCNQELQELNKKNQNQLVSNPPPHLAIGLDSLKDSNYIDRVFVDQYKYIRDKFNFDKQEILSKLSENIVDISKRDTFKAIKNLLGILNIDTLFQLSTLNSSSQFEILYESVSRQEQAMIKQFMKDKKAFDVVSFYSWLQNCYYQDDDTIYIKTSIDHEQYSVDGKTIVCWHDENICEGIQIICQNKLYDYSVQKMEICQ